VKNESLSKRFALELETLGGQVVFCPPEELSGSLLAFLKERQITSLFSWEMSKCGLPESLEEAIQAAGVQVTHTPDAQAQAGLTGATIAAAETGSVLVQSGLGMPLSASLLPEIHVIILHEEQIKASVAEALQTIDSHGGLPAALALISGPSRTADIEMTLTIGVHGPREVHVFCLPGSSTRPDHQNYVY
jgi:L-lactate dehydrogenase complex protein LldG